MTPATMKKNPFMTTTAPYCATFHWLKILSYRIGDVHVILVRNEGGIVMCNT